MNSSKDQGLQRLFCNLPAQDDGTIQLPIAAKTVCGGMTLEPTNDVLPYLFECVGFASELLLILSMEKHIELLKREANLMIRIEGELTVVWCDRLPLKLVKAMIANRQIIGLKVFPLERNNAPFVGFYVYEYESENQNTEQKSGYQRTAVPIHSLSLEDFLKATPERLATEISQRLHEAIAAPFSQLNFAQSTLIHPSDPNLIKSWSVRQE